MTDPDLDEREAATLRARTGGVPGGPRRLHRALFSPGVRCVIANTLAAPWGPVGQLGTVVSAPDHAARWVDEREWESVWVHWDCDSPLQGGPCINAVFLGAVGLAAGCTTP